MSVYQRVLVYLVDISRHIFLGGGVQVGPKS